jgi:hypothetical protein
MSKLTKFLNHPILFFKDIYKKYNVKIFDIVSKQLLEKIEVTPPPPNSKKNNKQSVFHCLEQYNRPNCNISGKIQKSYQFQLYILIDPFGRAVSSISSYVKNAYLILKNNSINFQIITKTQQESIIEFRKCIALCIQNIRKDGNCNNIIVEAPETSAPTINILPNQVKIHKRLHCSKSISNFISRQPLNEEYTIDEEQMVIDKADYISTPFILAFLLSKSILSLSENVSCYPNPVCEDVDLNIKRDNTSKTVLFVRKLHELKAVKWSSYLAKKLSDVSFYAMCPANDRYKYLFLPLNITLIDGKNWNKTFITERQELLLCQAYTR